MAAKLHDVIKIMEELAPVKMAEGWDNVGLMVGDPNLSIEKILVCLDVDENIAKESVEKNIDLIISHHPLIFSPIKNIRYDEPKGKLIRELIKNNINVYSAHTNLDISNGGINHWLGDIFGLEGIRPLEKMGYGKLYKLAVFVPAENADDVREALGESGAGFIGNYSNTSFSINGIGSFKPLSGANPHIGNVGEIERVDEIRIETIVKEEDLSKTIDRMISIHPYEEVAYDIYPLENKGMEYGLGIVGELKDSLSGEEFISLIKKQLKVINLRGSGNLPDMVKRVAICSGSGADLIKRARAMDADVLITGDIKYHDAQLAEELGIFAADAGHYSSEIIMIPYLSRYLRDKLTESGIELQVFEAESNRDYIRSY